MAYKMNGFGGFGNSPAKQYKKPTGPRAEVKPTKNEGGKGLEGSDIPLSPGFEDPIKIQKLQREGLTPGSQKLIKRKKNVDPFSLDERAYQNAQNDYDTSNPTKAQIAASKAKIKKEGE
tara:strand:+ start:419 stop:775 length:357 start_codon:yes stop_codon:yes gene_type:complete